MPPNPKTGWIEPLSALLPHAVTYDVPLNEISAWKVGGRAAAIFRPRNIAELSQLRRWLEGHHQPHIVIGATTNLLFADAGLEVPCIQIGAPFDQITVTGQRITVEAGAWVPALARRAMQAGLEGIAHTAGIPGTLGGLVCMNGGSQRHGIGEVIESVQSVDRAGQIHQRSGAECDFRYRHSIFQDNDELVVQATLALRPAPDRAALRREMLDILISRSRKFPRKLPNCGSVFISDPATYAAHGPPGAIIEKLGFKGRCIGGAEVSPRHANFIVNKGGATAQDILCLIGEITRAAQRELAAPLRAEVRYVAPDGSIRPASEVV